MSDAAHAGPSIDTGTSRSRFRLSGLMVLVLGVGLWLGVAGRVDALTAPSRSQSFGSPLTPWLGVALTPIGIAMALALGIQVLGLPGRREPSEGRAWPLCWRVAAVALLVALLAEQSRSLATVPTPGGEPNWPPGGRDWLVSDTRLRLLPCAEGLLLAGLVLGLRSPVPRTRIRLAGRWDWLHAVVAGLGGALIVAAMMMIPYLVLIAIEAVVNALQKPGAAVQDHVMGAAVRPPARSLAVRLDGSVPAVMLALLVALVTAAWLSSSLRKARRRDDRGWARELAVGLVLALAVLGTAAHLVSTTLPTIQPLAVSGLVQTLGTWGPAVIALGFGGFSAGLVAHALAIGDVATAATADPAHVPGNRGAMRVATGALVVLLLLLIWASLGEVERRSGAISRLIPGWPLLAALDPFQLHETEAWRWVMSSEWFGYLGADASFWFAALVLPWLAWRTSGLLLVAAEPGSSPLDQVVRSRASAGRFAGYGFALWALLMAAIPTLALAGLVALHRALASSS